MGKLYLTLLATLFSFMFISATAFSQPIMPPYPPLTNQHYHVYRVKKCKTVLVPFPHTECRYIYRRYVPHPPPPVPRYTPMPPRYTPMPPPKRGHGHHNHRPPPPPRR